MSARPSAHELDPDLRDRLLALDEPVAHPNWQDVVSRSGAERPRRTAVRATLVLVVACAAAIAVAPAMGLRLGPLNINFWSSPHAPPSAQSAFTEAKSWLGDANLRGLDFSQSRRIFVEVFRGDTERLFVAPRTAGGFCYVWATQPGNPGVWADELGGCAVHAQALYLGYDDTRISIVANRRLVDHVDVELDNGKTVEANLRWVSAPVNAGFVLYQAPSHTHALAVVAIGPNGVVQSDPIAQQIYAVPTR
ncbi:MAG TPA: hypothetical protein VGH52_11585 [Gaiellaceae bacterium]|jgi:hypothetical protein